MKSRNIVAFVIMALFTVVPLKAENPLPKVVLDGGMPTLELPPTLNQLIKKRFPDLRVPGKEDMTEGWSAYRGKELVPYACWGDFNGDGLTDVALILIGKGYWRLLAFHLEKDESYLPFKLGDFPGPDDIEFTKAHPPQEFNLFTLKAGQPVHINGKMINTESKYDTVNLFMIHDASSGIQYEWTQMPQSKDASHRLHGFYGVSAWGQLTD